MSRCGKLCKSGTCARCDAVRAYVADTEPTETLDEQEFLSHEARARRTPKGNSLRDLADRINVYRIRSRSEVT